MNRDFPLSPTPESTVDSVDVAKQKAGSFAKKQFDLSNKYFNRKLNAQDLNNFVKNNTALRDSTAKYNNIVFDASKKMTSKDLAKKGIKRNISAKGDTTTSYISKGVTFTQKNYNSKKK